MSVSLILGEESVSRHASPAPPRYRRAGLISPAPSGGPRHREERSPVRTKLGPVTAATTMISLWLAMLIAEGSPAYASGFTDGSAPRTDPIPTLAPQAPIRNGSTQLAPITLDTWKTEVAPAPHHSKTQSRHRKPRPTMFSFFREYDHGQYAKARESNAKLIIALGKKRHLSQYSIAIAIATSLQESRLLNLHYGDRDSLGLFQQRPSVGAWGTARQILNRRHAINQFYDRLVTISNRDQRSMMWVAIEIQIPSIQAYESTWHWDSIALQIVKHYW